MSFLTKMFGGKKEAAAPTTSEAIQKLRETEEMLIKKQDFLEKKIDLEITTAKKNASKNKRGAFLRVMTARFIVLSFISYTPTQFYCATSIYTNFRFSAAIQALKRKKRYEKQLQQIDGTLSTIEMQREALESANTNTAVLTTMKNAADALKAAHKHMYLYCLIDTRYVYIIDISQMFARSQGRRSSSRHDGRHSRATRRS